MSDVLGVITAIVNGEPRAADQLLPLVYQDLRALAARRLAREPPGQTLQATALVHEAYLRLVAANPERTWEGRRHFFGAASEAMRRILVENARHKLRLKHGGSRKRADVDLDSLTVETGGYDILALNEAIDALTAFDRQAAELVKLRHFGGLGTEEAGEVLGMPPRSAFRCWAFARAWLYRQLGEDEPEPPAAGSGPTIPWNPGSDRGATSHETLGDLGGIPP